MWGRETRGQTGCEHDQVVIYCNYEGRGSSSRAFATRNACPLSHDKRGVSRDKREADRDWRNGQVSLVEPVACTEHHAHVRIRHCCIQGAWLGVGVAWIAGRRSVIVVTDGNSVHARLFRRLSLISYSPRAGLPQGPQSKVESLPVETEPVSCLSLSMMLFFSTPLVVASQTVSLQYMQAHSERDGLKALCFRCDELCRLTTRRDNAGKGAP